MHLEKNETSKEKAVDVVVAMGPYGPLRWNDTPQGVRDRKACLLGRIAALYAYGTETTEECKPRTLFESPLKRSSMLRTVTKWADSMPTRNFKRRLVSICMDCPGVNAEALEVQPFDMDELERWYSWELEHLQSLDALKTSLARLWPGTRDGRPFADLGVPLDKYRRWRCLENLMSRDVERCLNEAWNAVIDDESFIDRPDFNNDKEAFVSWFQKPGRVSCRRTFVETWKREERRLLAIDPRQRDREYEREGV